jgi:uncharacterized short protein YbdD (DUF466 family)
MPKHWRQWIQTISTWTHALCGMRRYEAYLEHQRIHHPTATPMSREAFFNEALKAKYGVTTGKITRCC